VFIHKIFIVFKGVHESREIARFH